MLSWKGLVLAVPFLFAQVPATTNYQLRDYGFGNGGGSTSTGNYSVEGIAGEQGGTDSSTANYSARPGLLAVQMANVPNTPTIQNISNTYDKLHITINNGNNPSDATFAIAISSDGFATTKYVQNDNTIGPSLGTEDYQTYAAWGGSSGFDVIGLSYNTTYDIKVKATQGKFSESGYSPSANALTSDLTISFDIDVAPTDSSTSPPYQVSFGNLTASTVNDSPSKVWFSLDTNALSGGKIYIVSQNSGLKSAETNYTITSVSGDLSALSEGYGAQDTSATQTSGGPLAAASPYDGSGQNIGLLDGTYRSMFSSSAPVTGGRTSFVFKAKTTSQTPAAPDYADIYTAVAAASF